MSRRRRATRRSLPDEEWVAVEFVEDQEMYRCTAKRVLDCVKDPDLFNVVWSDGRKYAAKILKRGSKEYVFADDVEPLQGIKDQTINQNPEAEDSRAEKQTSVFAKDCNVFVTETQQRQNLHKESGTEDIVSDNSVCDVVSDIVSDSIYDDTDKDETFHPDPNEDSDESNDELKAGQIPGIICSGIQQDAAASTFQNEVQQKMATRTGQCSISDEFNANSDSDSELSDVYSVSGTTVNQGKRHSAILQTRALSKEVADTAPASHESYIVRACANTASGKRKFDKRHYCLYCRKAVQQLPKHFERKHKHESDVSKLMKLKKGSEERKLLLLKLRNHGDYLHNSEVHRLGKGIIVTNKSLTNPRDPEDYLNCRFCRGTFIKDHISRHLKTCKLKPDDEKEKTRMRVQSSCALMTPPVHTASEGLVCNILKNMKHDQISAVIRRDYLVMEFGSKLYSKVAQNADKFKNVYNKLRELGTLLIALKETHPDNRGLSEFISPHRYKDIVQAIKKASKWDEKTGKIQNPHLALKLGYHLKKIAHIKIRDGLTSMPPNSEKAQDAEQFLKLREREWADDISSHALREIRQRKFNAPVILPVVEDLLSLQSHLKEIGEEHFKKLSEDNSDRTSWYELSKVLLTMVILFNRRRSGEASRMLLSHYLDRSKTPLHEDIGNALSDFEKKLCNNLVRFEVESNTGKAVPVILTKKMKKYVDLLISTRNSVGVNPENTHLFARPYFNSMYAVTGSECLRKYAYECGAKHPEYITATRLRKHIATVSQVFNLTENEIELLCRHMGHDPKVHRNFYRLPEGTLQVAKLSRILIAMERGEAHLYKGKKLDDIEFNPDEVLEMEEEILEEEAVLHSAEIFPGNENSEGLDKDIAEMDSQNVMDSGSKGKKNEASECNKVKKGKRKEKQKVKHVPWTKEERHAVLIHLSSFVREGCVPGKQDCEKCKSSSGSTLVNRDWKGIKFYVKNEITKRQRGSATSE